MSKVCDKCHREYSGFGNTCGKCRRLLRTRGSILECGRCGAFSVGFSEECEECRLKDTGLRPSTQAYADGRYTDQQYAKPRSTTDLSAFHNRMKIAATRAFGADWMKVFPQLDKDHSGQITWEEFRSFCRVSLHLVDDEACLKQFFRQFDKDGSGSISIDELISFVDDPVTRMRALLKAATYQQAGDEWANYLRLPELSTDGVFSWKDFCQLCRSRLHIHEEDLQLSMCFKAIAGEDEPTEVGVEDLVAFVGTTVCSMSEPLQVTIISCRGLESQGYRGMVETFATVELLGKHVSQKKVRTPLLNMAGKVIWNHTGYIADYSDQEYLLASVWIKRGMRKDDLMGRAKIVVADVYPKGFQGEVQLHEGDTAHRHGGALPVFLEVHVKKAVHGAQKATPHLREHRMSHLEGNQMSHLKHTATNASNASVGRQPLQLKHTASNLSSQPSTVGDDRASEKSMRKEGPRLKFIDDRCSGTGAKDSPQAAGRGAEGQPPERHDTKDLHPHLEAAAAKDQEGAGRGTQEAAREIAELKRTQEALRRTIAEKEKENAKLRHDLAEVQHKPENLKVGAYRMSSHKEASKPGDGRGAGTGTEEMAAKAPATPAGDRSAELAAKDEQIERLRHDLDDVLVNLNGNPSRLRNATQDYRPGGEGADEGAPDQALATYIRAKSTDIAAKDKQIDNLKQELEAYKHANGKSSSPDTNGHGRKPGADGSPGHGGAYSSEALLKSLGEKNSEILEKDKELSDLHQDLAVLRIRHDAMDVDASRLTASKDAEIASLKEALENWERTSSRATAGR